MHVNDISNLKDGELQELKSFLVNQKGYILNKTHEFRSEHSTNQGPVSDESEQASKDVSDTVAIHLHERERNTLMQIEKALSKITELTYGECESCGDAIGAKRLKVSPFALFCLACQEEAEDRRLN